MPGRDVARALFIPAPFMRLAMLKPRVLDDDRVARVQGPAGEATTTAPRNSDHSAAHIGLRVHDAEAAAAHLEAFPASRSSRDRDGRGGGATTGVKSCYFVAPWGLMMELVQLPEGMAV